MTIDHQAHIERLKDNPPPNDMNAWLDWRKDNSHAVTMAKPLASAPLTKLTSAEHAHLLHWLATHTALGRLSGIELEGAFARLEAEAGFILVMGAGQ